VETAVQGGCRFNQIVQTRPIVSIVVVVFRDCAELTALLQNLSPFRSAQTELIVIDGGSDDGSRDALQRNNEQVDFWLSEPDTGIYDAMNKGIAAARGEYIIHINAGDRLLHLPIAELSQFAERQIDVVCCRVLEDNNRLYTPRGGWWIRIDNPWHHQGTFYRRTAHLGYDPSYRIFGDLDHNQRISKAAHSIEFVPATIATHRTNGVSSNREARQEIYRSIRSNFGAAYLVPALIRFGINRLRNIYRPGFVIDRHARDKQSIS
jgi:glycosyltransferase involved in cell wall biosynthesis